VFGRVIVIEGIEPFILYLSSPMELSDCMAVAPAGILVYIGQKGELFEIVGGRDGQINLRTN